jgi:hypothetical protein
MWESRTIRKPLMHLNHVARRGFRGSQANPRTAGQIAELISLREKVASADTRTRVDATHRV